MKSKGNIDKVLKKPIDSVIYLIELVHTIPSNNLLMLKKAVDLELLDRKYLDSNSWFGKMLNRMRADTYG
jgi:hypothetical protein